MPNRRDFIKSATLATAATSLNEVTVASTANKKLNKTNPNFRTKLLECLGGPWPEGSELRAQVSKIEPKDGYRLEWIDYELQPGDRCPAILLVPDGISDSNPAPAVAVWHQHAGQWHLGKTEPAGLDGNPMHHTGVALAKLGYVVLCPDALCFEDRQDPGKQLQDGDYERYEFLRYTVSGQCLAWKNILDMRRAVDYLVSRGEVNASRIGCYGHSMGSTHVWLVGPWEPRLRALVGNCCLPTYAGIHRTKLLHCFSNFIPGLYAHGDTPDIAALIAPRALHLNLGENDLGTPLSEAKVGIQNIAHAYQAAGASDKFSAFIEPDSGHALTEKMWDHTQNFFAKHLA